MKQKHLRHQFVEFIPERLEEGVIYISQHYSTVTHKCCCGCGEEVITPLTPTDWSLHIDGNAVTLYPSIGNWSFSCQSHYWIRRSKVIWAYQMSQKRIELGREKDRDAKKAYFETVNRDKNLGAELSSNENSSQTDAPGFLYTMWSALKRWFSS